MTGRAIEDSRALASAFDALAEALEARQIRVHRLPILLTRSATSLQDIDDAQRPYARSIDYPILTYNNVLQEERDGARRVYLPGYGFDALDEAAQSAWQSLGREVTVVEGYATSSLYGGALRCSAKVLERSRDR